MAKKLTTEEIIGRLYKLHGNRYGYSMVDYRGSSKKIRLVCSIHGEFCAFPGNMLNKGTGCKKCADISNGEKARKTTEEFTQAAESKHPNMFTYSKTKYMTNTAEVTITCKVHGDFLTTPAYFFDNTYGCPTCAEVSRGQSIRSNTEEFIKTANTVHNNYYSYKHTKYTLAKNTVIVTCPIHGDFAQKANNHLNGRGCLYYLKVTYGPYVAYKIGITNNSVKDRYKQYDLDKITIIKTWEYAKGLEARDREKEILSDFKVYKWKGPKLLNNGNTKLFDKDILELDKKDLNG